MSIATKCICGMSLLPFCLSGVKECKQFSTEKPMQNKYPIGGYAPGVPKSRLMAEKFFDEEYGKITDATRRVEVMQEKETWIACYMAGYKESTPTGAVWVKCSERHPEMDGYYCFKANGGYMGAYLRTASNGSRWWCDSAGGTIRNWKNCEWLDESPSKESDAVEFAGWLAENTEIIREEKITLYRYCDKINEWGNYTLEDIYQVFKLKSHEES